MAVASANKAEPSALVKLYSSAISERYGRDVGDSMWKYICAVTDSNGNLIEPVMTRVISKGEKDFKLGEDFGLFSLGFMGGSVSDL